MKQVLFIFLMMYSVFSVAQTSGSVSIKFIDSRATRESDYYSYDGDEMLPLYKVTNGLITGRMCDFTNRDSIFIADIDSGLYHFKYHNLFGEKIDKFITINVGHHSSVIIAMDSLMSYDNNILKDLNKGDSVVLFYKNSGCFEYEVRKITIRNESGFVAKLYECDFAYSPTDNTSIQNGIYYPGQLIKEVRMNDKQIAAFVRFENELNSLSNSNGCTTTTFYKLIVSDGFWLDRQDGGCSWYGYDYLKEAIFGLLED